MGFFGKLVFEAIKRNKITIRGSRRTKRLRKKHYKHWHELYVLFRDKYFLKKHGINFKDWFKTRSRN